MSAIEQCPILYPTLQEFQNFYPYMEIIEAKYSKDYGMVKVIPPKGFKARSEDYIVSLDKLTVAGPIEQNVYGKGGHYECLHVQKKSMLLKDYRRKQSEVDGQLIGKTQEEVEELFWKNLSFSPPLYGADIKVSLMDTKSQWNFNNLQSILTEGLSQQISGVNEPYIYVGSWKTFFAWHKEDMDLSATNYLHYGKPKFWYCIREEDHEVLENYAKATFVEHFRKCPEHLRHKTTLINPYLLKQKFPQIKISKTAQNENEFIFVFGGAYHTGFNWGFNIAEAVNYATLNWLNLFQKARPCRCVSDSVKININDFCQNMQKGKFKNNLTVKNFCHSVLSVQKPQEIQKIQKKPIRRLEQSKTTSICWAQCEKCDSWKKIPESKKCQSLSSQKVSFFCSSCQDNKTSLSRLRSFKRKQRH